MQGLGVVSWIIVFIPFIMMTLIITILLFMFGMDPKSGKLNLISSDTPPPEQPDARKDAIQNQISNTTTKLPANTSTTPITSTVHDIYYDNQTNKIVDLALQQ